VELSLTVEGAAVLEEVLVEYLSELRNRDGPGQRDEDGRFYVYDETSQVILFASTNYAR